MSKMNQSLSDIFGIELAPTEKSYEVEKVDKIEEEIDSDEAVREYAARNLIELIEKGKTALDELHDIAKDTEKSRDFEVMLNGIKSIADINERLIEVSKKPEKPKEVEAGTVTNNTAVFVGTTADLQKILKNKNLVIDNEGTTNE